MSNVTEKQLLIPYEKSYQANCLFDLTRYTEVANHHWAEFWNTHSSMFVQGDSFDLVSKLPSNSVDLIITSPPYWGQRTYGLSHNWEILEEWRALGHKDNELPPYEWYREYGGTLGLEPIPDWYITRLVELFELAKRALKPSGSLWVNLGDTYYARWSSIRDKGRQGLGGNERIRRRTPMGDYRQEKQLLLIPGRFAIEMQKHRWILRNDLIWYKPNIPPRPEKDRLRLSHEHFFHFVKRPKEGRARYYYDLDEAEPEQNDVVAVTVRQGAGNHSATFPEELIRPRILTSSPEGGLVLDPFCGVGTAVNTATRNGRKALGFDRVPSFLETAITSSHRNPSLNGKANQ